MVKKFLLILFNVFVISCMYAQERQVKGVVISAEDGEPIIGASVSIVGTTQGTVTDFDGNFMLNIPASAKKITVSYVGMKPLTVDISQNMNITLYPDATQIDEVVVTGYQKIDRRLFTGSAEKLTADKALMDGEADVSRMLQGKVAGVAVQNVSGTFGAAPKLKVRGASSIYGNQSPLWVVDGVILEDVVEIPADALSSGDATTLISSAVAGLNADDIESFQILKDASASALYGARAMNGVVVITTKKGKSGSYAINYSGEFTTRLKPSYSDFNLMDSQEQMDVNMELYAKGWLAPDNLLTRSNWGVFGYMYNQMYKPDASGNFLLKNYPEEIAKYLQAAEMRNTDWFDELFRYSVIQNHSLSLSAGSEKNKNYASLSIYNDPGWTMADQVQRFTGNFNTTNDISNTVSLTFATTGSIREQQAPGTLNRTANVVEGEFSRDFDINPFSYALNTSRTADPSVFYQMNYAPFNIKDELLYNTMDISQVDLKLQGELAWKPIKGLDFNLLGSYRYVKSTTETKINENSNMAGAYRADQNQTVLDKNMFLYRDPDDPIAWPVVVLPEGGFYNREDFKMSSMYVRFTGNYNKAFNEIHLTNFLLGSEIKSTDRTNSFSNGYGYQWNRGGTAFTDYRILKMMLEGDFAYFGLNDTYTRSAAFFATGSYSYLGKYTLNVTGRMDGTNQLGKEAENKWLPTWNASTAWNVKEEDFLKDNDVISQLQLRLTYGMNANPAPAYANALAIYRSALTFRPEGDKENQIYIESLENKELTWEKQYELNAGFDLGLFNNRLSLSFDAYNRDCFDLIAPVKTSGIGGQYYKWANYATMYSRGVEFSLGGQILAGPGLNWNANMTFSYAKNEITDMQSNPSVMDLVSPTGGPRVGYPARGLYSLQFAGLTEKGYPQVINEKGQVTVGEVYFQEAQNLGHLVYEGPVDAPYQGGLNNGFALKNWKLNVFLTYQFGNVIRLDQSFKAGYTDLDVMPKELKNRWVLPGDEKYTNIPVIPSYTEASLKTLSTAYNAYNFSTERVASGSFIRLKEIFLAYDVPSKFVHSFKLNNIQLKLTASNIALLYADEKLNGQDPEFFRSGGVAMPTPRQFTLTLKVGL